MTSDSMVRQLPPLKFFTTTAAFLRGGNAEQEAAGKTGSEIEIFGGEGLGLVDEFGDVSADVALKILRHVFLRLLHFLPIHFDVAERS